MSTCAVSATSAATGPTDIGCGELVTPTRDMKCTVELEAYAPVAAVGATTTLSAITVSGGTRTAFGLITGSQGATLFPAPIAGAPSAIAQWTMVGNITSGSSINFGCRMTNLLGGAGEPVACNVSWTCF